MVRIAKSLLQDLLQVLPHLHGQIYFNSSLKALCRAIEDQVLARADQPLVIASFQHKHFYQQQIRRYQKIAQRTEHVYVLTPVNFGLAAIPEPYQTIGFEPDDALAREWHLVVVSPEYTACLVCRERSTPGQTIGQAQLFEGIWSFDPRVSIQAAQLLLKRISIYQPELAPKLEEAWQRYQLSAITPDDLLLQQQQDAASTPFAERLVTHLQASQYKLLKAQRAIALNERKERLINSITVAIRRSLNSQEILAVAVKELGLAFDPCRCLVYCCDSTDRSVVLEHEHVASGIPSVRGMNWPLADNPIAEAVLAHKRAIAVSNVAEELALKNYPALQERIERWQIQSWLVVPILHQGTLLGMLELHRSGSQPLSWKEYDLSLVEAIATRLGVALIQSQAYSQLEDLNNQLEALERTRSNLIAIVGHELRTPLSTIQVCLESLAEEPCMSPDMRQIMIQTAMADAERLRKLVQDFLTLSQLEGRTIQSYSQAVPFRDCLELALSSTKAHWSSEALPQIVLEVPGELPLIRVGAEELTEVLIKLLDNACKFTGPDGKVTVKVQIYQEGNGDIEAAYHQLLPALKVVVSDTGQGIEPSQLQNVFDRFYQVEAPLRRTRNGTGLGLAICRQIVQGLGGHIWAESPGHNQGSQFHFIVPIEESPDPAESWQAGHQFFSGGASMPAPL